MKHIAYINEKPRLSGVNSTPDGAVAGNGDLAVIFGNAPCGLRIFLSKTDVWYAVDDQFRGGLRPVGYIDVPVPAEAYDNYRVEQDMDEGMIRCRFQSVRNFISLTVRVGAGENVVLIEKTGNLPFEPVLRAYDLGETDGESGVFDADGFSGVFRSFEGEECLYPTRVCAALVCPDEKTCLVSVATNHDAPCPESEAARLLSSAADGIGGLKDRHAAYWRDFRSKSDFRLSDSDLEMRWHAGLYFLAVCARNTRFPPGLYANFITVERPNWHSDYHLNYNFQAPFYPACSSNHPELTDCYMTPLEEFIPKGREFARRFGCGGVLYPCGIGPKGYMTEHMRGIKYEFERPFMGQKSDALHAADIAVFRWRATFDVDFAREHAYPYLRECLDFFTDYAVLEDGRYSVPDDAAHEVPYYKDDFTEKKYPEVHDRNNVVTLGLLRLCIPAAIEMAEALDVDSDRREKWRDLLDRLSPFPTCIRFGRRVYRYTEKGMRWHGDNDVGQQHIFPCGCIGLSSSARELKIARNTVNQKKYCFTDGNAVSSFYAIGARIGFHAGYMVDRLREFNKKTGLPNFLYCEGGGGLEYCAVNATALNEMALQSHQGVVRIFPDWDARLDAEFRDLRADGAFLVSSSIKGGEVGSARIVSEKGGLLKVVFPADKVRVTVNGSRADATAERLLAGLMTNAGDAVVIERA